MKIVFIFIFIWGSLFADDYRIYDETTNESVKNFYLLNHTHQTLDFVLRKKAEYIPLRHKKMSIWEALDYFDQLIDESDPDLSLPQSYHCYQTAEALRKAGYPRWLILTGFIHDLGKLLALFGEPQWAIVGDTFPVGCAWSEKIVFSEYFKFNPDIHISEYQTPLGIYSTHCGLDKIHMSWGHDEYLYQVFKEYLPEEALFIIRYHSFYSLHKEGAYLNLLNEKDLTLLPWLKLFSTFDLYSKSEEKLDLKNLKPFYIELCKEFLPNEIQW